MALPLQILQNDLLPILLMAGAGYVLAQVWRLDVETVSKIAFNALTPCLVFHLLTTSTLGGGEIGRLAVLTAIVVVAAGGAAWVASLPFRLDPPTRAGFLIAVMFANAGNYGLSVVMFAFGEQTAARAAIYFVANSVLTLTLGVAIASGGRAGRREVLVRVARVPVVYAIAAAAVVSLSGLSVPVPIARPVGLLAGAAIPVMLLVLGMQLHRHPWPGRPGLVAIALVLVLVGRPAFGWTASAVLGLSGPARDAAILESAMPTAVLATIVALEFRAAPAFVTAVVAVSTILSPLTVTGVIWMLKSGW